MDLHETRERLRLRRHFATVLAELRRAPLPPGASPEQRAATLRELARYARAGAFPRHGGRGAPRPVFVDHRGTRCAMAHLVEWNGGADAVRRVAATRNHAYVPELAASPEVADAIRRLGLSEAEAARIQPAYDSGPSVVVEVGASYALLWIGAAAMCCAVLGVVALFRAPRWSERVAADRRRRRAAAKEAGAPEEHRPGESPWRTPWRTSPASPPAGSPSASATSAGDRRRRNRPRSTA